MQDEDEYNLSPVNQQPARRPVRQDPPPTAAKPNLPASKPKQASKPSSAGPLLILIAVVLAAVALVVGVNWIVHRSIEERKTRDAFSQMNQQANEEAQRGHKKEAVDLYAKALQYATEHKLLDDLREAVEEMRQQKEALETKLAAEAAEAKRRDEQRRAADAETKRQLEAEQQRQLAAQQAQIREWQQQQAQDTLGLAQQQARLATAISTYIHDYDSMEERRQRRLTAGNLTVDAVSSAIKVYRREADEAVSRLRQSLRTLPLTANQQAIADALACTEMIRQCQGQYADILTFVACDVHIRGLDKDDAESVLERECKLVEQLKTILRSVR